MSDPADRLPNACSRPAKPLFDRSEDHAYFRAVEALFIELRGAPFQLSPDDFKIARLWRSEGVPLDVALATLREKVTDAAEKGDEPKSRLSYYRRAVESAWKRQRELAAPGVEAKATELDVASRLARLASRVPESPSDSSGKSLAKIRAQLEALGSEGSAEEVDKALADIDRDMLKTARRDLAEEQRTELASRVEAAMAALSGRLGGASSSARERAETRLLRDMLDLPLLSLFSPDALES